MIHRYHLWANQRDMAVPDGEFFFRFARTSTFEGEKIECGNQSGTISPAPAMNQNRFWRVVQQGYKVVHLLHAEFLSRAEAAVVMNHVQFCRLGDFGLMPSRGQVFATQ